MSYARTFRIIAAALKSLQLESFDLEIRNGEYDIRGFARAVEPNAASSEKAKNLSTIWRGIRNRFFPQPSMVSFELHYTQENLRALDSEGGSQRGNPQRYPDIHSLSETLRAVGEFLDAKRATLSRLSMRGRWITLHYKSPQGHLVVKEHTANSLYHVWLAMCARRTSAQRSSSSKTAKQFLVEQ